MQELGLWLTPYGSNNREGAGSSGFLVADVLRTGDLHVMSYL